MSTLYWSHSNNNPSTAEAWGGQKPTSNDSVVFTWGTIVLDDVKWDAKEVTLAGGSTVTTKTIPENADLNLTNGSTLHSLDIDNISLGNISVTGGSNGIFSGEVTAKTLDVNNGSHITFNKGLVVDDIKLTGGSTIHISGPFYVDGQQITKTGNITYLFPSAVNTGSEIIYDGNQDTCYLDDCDILTPYGYHNVTELNVGDLIINKDGESVKILWIGVGHTKAIPNMKDDTSGYPICITKGSLGNNIPNKDIHVTPEHSVFVDGILIPVRLLVNDISIYYDNEIKEYDFYHILTEKHNLIHVNNMISETYLKSGNEIKFINMDSPDVKSEIVSPIVTSGETFNRVITKISNLVLENYEDVEVYEPSEEFIGHTPHIVINGRVYYPYNRVGNKLFFIVFSFNSFTIGSDSARPCDVIGRHNDDRRYLGACINKVIVNQKEVSQDNYGDGWYGNWTNGSGEVNIKSEKNSNTIVLEI